MDKCHEPQDFINPKIKERMKLINKTIAVMSNKGGVGKSTVSVNIAAGLAMRNYKVGLFDADLHGPSVFKMLGIEGKKIFVMEDQIMPLEPIPNLKVISMAGLIDSCESPLIWRGPLKIKVIEQFLADVEWGNLDFLIVDLPPGTGDEPLTIMQFIPDISGSIIVTTPQEVATLDARKAINFARKLNTSIIGIVENMSGMICPHCKEEINIFKRKGGKNVSLDMNVPFLGELGFDPQIVEDADAGKSFIHSKCSDTVKKQLESILDNIQEYSNLKPADSNKNKMRIAIPVANDSLCLHFGHCEKFMIFDVADGKISGTNVIDPPEHSPGVIPEFLAGHKVECVLAGGMGSRAKEIFDNFGIKVITGVMESNPSKIVESYLNGNLETGVNTCDH